MSIRELLDAYLKEKLPKRAARSAREAVKEEYEALYDLPKTELSLSRAASIERLSWETTERLVEAFEEREEETAPALAPVAPVVPVADGNATAPDFKSSASNPWERFFAYLSAILSENAAEKRAAVQNLCLPEEVVVDEINTLAADLLGDILLEENDCGFGVIDDYRDTLREILNG